MAHEVHAQLNRDNGPCPGFRQLAWIDRTIKHKAERRLLVRIPAGAVEKGETPQQFAHRLDAALRTQKERAVEEWGATEAAPRVAAYEEVAREALMADARQDPAAASRWSLAQGRGASGRPWRRNARQATTGTIGATTASAEGTGGARTSARAISGGDRRNHSGLRPAPEGDRARANGSQRRGCYTAREALKYGQGGVEV
ncbi:hypothetical protein AAG570_012581 [Ranatra chinensis]|uniref:Uncharacterized protein n=1 Tax=Ranatra chinensis TaxID=642074 RepID=A0ABD0YEK4_9HEMI